MNRLYDKREEFCKIFFSFCHIGLYARVYKGEGSSPPVEIAGIKFGVVGERESGGAASGGQEPF